MSWLPWRRRETDGENPLMRIRHDLDRMMDDVMRGIMPAQERVRGPAVDVRETDGDVFVEIEVPGLKPEDLDITVTENTLTIKGEKKVEREGGNGDVYRSERACGRFIRTIELPAPIDSEKADASYSNGVITVKLPKTERARGRRVPVK